MPALRASTLLLPALLALGVSEAKAEDRWWARDKALHFGVSGTLAMAGYAGGALLVDERWQRASVGAGVALCAGIAKELYDEVDYGGASYKDLVFDLAGTAVGVAAAWLVDWAINGERKESTGTSTAAFAVAF